VVHPEGVKAPAGPPVRVMVVGDSMAGSLGAALAPEAPAYGVQIINEGHPGCAVTTDEEFRVLLYRAPPGAPCQTGQPTALLDKWREWVDEYRPQVVIYLARVDLVDQEFDGTFSSIDDPAFDAYFRSQLDAGVGVLSSRGAHVVLMTSPYYDSTLYSGGTVPEDAPQRVTMDDTILRQVASTRPDVTVFPLGSIVSPDGYQQDVDGVDIRCQDGVHLSSSAGEVVGPALLPELVRLGRAVHLTDVPLSTTSTTPVPPPPPVPAWYHKLPCYGLF
ncbi:MAG: SGNH hydrolase domain-containing protein, partial [Acidimicrobiales bacterium]